MRMKIVLLIFVLISVMQTASGSSGIGVGVNPGKMNFELAPGTSEGQSLYVINTGSETATYSIFVDGTAYDDWFTFSSSSFDLKAGDNKEVKVKLSIPESAKNDVECKLKVPCTVSGRAIGTGIIIPVHIDISAPEESSSESISLRDDFSRSVKDSLKSFINEGVNEVSKQLIVNGNSLVDNFTQSVTWEDQELKGSAENLGVIVTRSFNNSTRRFDNSLKNFDDTIKKLEDSIKKYDDLTGNIEDRKENFEDEIKIVNNVIKNIYEKFHRFLTDNV